MHYKVAEDERYPQPNIESILRNKRSSMILSRPWHAPGLPPNTSDSCAKTTFCTPDSYYEYTSLLFGLEDAPSCSQRVVNQLLSGLIGRIGFLYLYIIVVGTIWKERSSNLAKNLVRLVSVNFSLKLEKCKFFRSEVNYLGHIISSSGIRPQTEEEPALKAKRRCWKSYNPF